MKLTALTETLLQIIRKLAYELKTLFNTIIHIPLNK